jgi:AraC-like DNA-binding protein
MNHRTLLHASADAAVIQFDHPPHEVHEDPDREVSLHWGIAFVRSGNFDVAIGGTNHRLVRGSLFITSPGLTFTCSHACEYPDDVCVSIGFADAAISGLEHAWARAGWAARRVPTPRLAYVGTRLMESLGSHDGFATERWTIAALMALGDDSLDPGVRGSYRPRVRDIEAVVTTCRAIEAHPELRDSVADRARSVGMTSPQLTHAFRRYVRMSPHHYTLRWRLAKAATLLDSGHAVSQSCWDSGFENLSHFCRSFRRAFAVRPSRWHQIPIAERRRKVQAYLTGGA